MFSRYEKNALSDERAQSPPTLHAPRHRAPLPFASELVTAMQPPQPAMVKQDTTSADTPEVVVAEGVTIKGVLSFQRLIRIDGVFEGEFQSSGKLIIGPTGIVKANIHLDEAFISGKVTGNITVKTRLVLRGRAEICGDITAPILSVDEGVSIDGILNVHQPKPEEIDRSEEDDHYSSDN